MKGSIRVVSKRVGGVRASPGECVIDGSRKNPVLGNRHVLFDHRDPDERARVIYDHQVQDLEPDVLVGGPIFLALKRIADRVQRGERLAFACWCAPSPCHCDPYVEIVEKVIDGWDAEAIYLFLVERREATELQVDQFDFGF